MQHLYLLTNSQSLTLTLTLTIPPRCIALEPYKFTILEWQLGQEVHMLLQ